MPLHTDDPSNEGNVDSKTYFQEMREMREKHGDDAVHAIPADILEAAMKSLGEV